MRLRWVACAGVVLLGGCGVTDWLEGKDKTEYKTSSALPPLEVPPDLSAPTRDNRYVVPDNAGGPGTSTATLSGYQAERKEAKPAASGILPPVDNVHVERAGSQRWLVVDQPPEKLWPVIKDFWQENGFLVKTEQPQVGVMETDWAESRPKIADGALRNVISRALDQFYSSGQRDKFRTRLERTADGKGTEIYISHRGLEEVYETRDAGTAGSGSTKWQWRPSDPELEAEYMSRLMVRLGVQDQQKATEAVKSAAQGEERARIKKGVSGELLEVYEPFDRVWRRVGLALDRVGFTVEDRDRQKGLYFVRYADPESEKNKPGLFARIFSTNRTLTTEQYRVQVVEAGTSSEVNVLNKDGAADTSKTAQRILALLHEQLK
jgi:outer membrane protein assembly factor BamC